MTETPNRQADAARSRLMQEIVGELHRTETPYAFLRGYDEYPIIGRDVDLVLAESALDTWREIASRTAEACGWETVTECDHWHRGLFAHQSVDVFHFYDPAGRAQLQIDLFHGTALWGQPLATEESLLSERAFDSGRGIYRIAPHTEQTQRLLQVARADAGSPRFQWQRDSVLRHHAADPAAFEETIQDSLGSNGVAALRELAYDDGGRIRRELYLARTKLLMKNAKSRPVATSRHFLAFVRKVVRLRTYGPCGLVIQVHASDAAARERWRATMRHLEAETFIIKWTDSNAHRQYLGPRDRAVRALNVGLVTKWAPAASSDIDVDALDDQGLMDAAMRRVITHHETIYEQHPVGVLEARKETDRPSEVMHRHDGSPDGSTTRL